MANQIKSWKGSRSLRSRFNRIDGRHVGTRTPDLYRVNLEFTHLQPFGSVAFPLLTTQKTGLKGPIFADKLLTTPWHHPAKRVLAKLALGGLSAHIWPREDCDYRLSGWLSRKEIVSTHFSGRPRCTAKLAGIASGWRTNRPESSMTAKSGFHHMELRVSERKGTGESRRRSSCPFGSPQPRLSYARA